MSPRGPNLFLIAAPRAGSTQMARWLASHGEIQLSAVKEPNFFSAHEFDPLHVAQSHLNDVDPARFAEGDQARTAQFAVFRKDSDYQALFQRMSAPWRMEASTSYLACPETPAAIKDMVPDARLIFLTRDPLTRALSHYRLARRTGRVQASLGEVLEDEISGRTPIGERILLRPSNQAAGLRRYQSLFKPNQCLFLQFEKVISNPAQALEDVASWLGLNPAGFDLAVKAQNAGHAPRFPHLNRVLQTSGIKTSLRRALPVGMKKRLKPLWFDATRTVAISAADQVALAAALRRAGPPLLPSLLPRPSEMEISP